MNNLYRIEEIKRDIQYYKNLINSSNGEITRLRREIENLDNTHQKYVNVRNQYDEFQYNHEQQSKALQLKFNDIKFSKKLSTNINEGLRGNKARKSSNGMEQVIRNIQMNIRRDDQEIKDEQDRIYHYNNQIDELEYELRNLMYG